MVSIEYSISGDYSKIIPCSLQYGADVTKLDLEGRSALWYAKKVCSTECAMILQSNGCQDGMTLPRARRGSLRTDILPTDKHKDRASLNSIH